MRIDKFILRAFLILGVALSAPVTWAARITVTVDRDPAVLSESFELTFESDGDVDNDPDFSPLNRDFQVLSSGEGSNISVINGRVTTSKSWTLNVMARRPGQLSIPPIAFGSDRSEPATVNVVSAAPGGSTGNNREIFLEAGVNTDHPYVQAEVIYTLRLFRSVDTANATLSDPPVVSGGTAVVERLGDDRSYETQRGGDRYSVVERKYAVYPQASGTLSIGPMVFQGQITRGFSFFGGPFGRQPRTVSVQSDPVRLEVQATPAAFTGKHWLPARQMTLMEEWSQYPLRFKVDEPLTRTVTLTATGLTASQLPELPAWQTGDFKRYPDQPVLEDSKQSQGVTGKRVEKIAMIPHRAGMYTLPEISIPWWNTATNKLEYATIPERQIEVVGPAAGAQLQPRAPAPLPGQQPSAAGPAPGTGVTPVPGGSATVLGDRLTAASPRFWQGLSAALLILWIATLLLWRRAGRAGPQPTTADNAQSSRRALIRKFKQACLDNHPGRAKEILLDWGRLTWPESPPASIGDIAGRCSETLATELRLLNNALYSRAGGNWQGRDLWLAFEQELIMSEKKTETTKGQLEPLFKI